MLMEKAPVVLAVLCFVLSQTQDVQGSTYYMDNSEYDCSSSNKYVYSASDTVKAWKYTWSKPTSSPFGSSCLMTFDTLDSTTRVKVRFSTVTLNCDTTLTFYDGSSTLFSSKLRTLTCSYYSTSDFYSTSRYLTVKLSTTSSRTDYDFKFYVSEEDDMYVGYISVGGIIGGVVGSIVFLVVIISVIVCVCRANQRRGVVYRQTITTAGAGVVNPNFMPPNAPYVATSSTITAVHAPPYPAQPTNQMGAFPPPQSGGYPQQTQNVMGAPPPYPAMGYPAPEPYPK